ncbi:hypothetical protein KC19_7G176000 [Ceratodon purpureus]|uniref:Uncharacterized protein n=1 Tax=Ceratodon purpureus TaxID=3225 RepID=A0A8T0HC26_CERPU|nr:hypothetical protein KC19_7G176000 [Ceratodon purpureus]
MNGWQMSQHCCFSQLVAQEGLRCHVHGASYTNDIRQLKFGSVGIGIIVPYIRIKPGWICVAEIVSNWVFADFLRRIALVLVSFEQHVIYRDSIIAPQQARLQTRKICMLCCWKSRCVLHIPIIWSCCDSCNGPLYPWSRLRTTHARP